MTQTIATAPSTTLERAISRDQRFGMAALVLCALLWSLNGPLIKLLAPQGHANAMPAVTIAFYRSLLGGLALAPVALLLRRGTTASKAVGKVARNRTVAHDPSAANTEFAWRIASIVCFTLMTVTFVAATTRIPAASAIVLQYTAPAWVFLLAATLLGETARRTDLISLAVALVGVAVIFTGAWSRDGAGLLIALSSGVSYGALIVTLRRLRGAAPLGVTTTNALGSALLLAPLVWLNHGFGLSGSQVLYVGALGIIQFCLPYAIFSWALRRVEAGRSSLILLLETVFNPLFTFLAVGEVPPFATFIGGGFILLSVLIGVFAPSSKPSAMDAESTTIE